MDHESARTRTLGPRRARIPVPSAAVAVKDGDTLPLQRTVSPARTWMRDAEVPVAAAAAAARGWDVSPRPRTRRMLPPAIAADEEGEAWDGKADRARREARAS
jgi:hypothetical protein